MARGIAWGAACAALLAAGSARGAAPVAVVALATSASVSADGAPVSLERADRCVLERTLVARSPQAAGAYVVYAHVAVENEGEEPVAARCFVAHEATVGAGEPAPWVTVPAAWQNSATRAFEPGVATVPVVDVSVVAAGGAVEIRCEQKCSSSALRAALHRLVVTAVDQVVQEAAR